MHAIVSPDDIAAELVRKPLVADLYNHAEEATLVRKELPIFPVWADRHPLGMSHVLLSKKSMMRLVSSSWSTLSNLKRRSIQEAFTLG